MRDTLVKDIMIPIADYVTVKKQDSLPDVLAAIEAKRQAQQGHAHRDAIVMDADGRLIGKVTMIDIFRALEPSFPKIRRERRESTLTEDFVKKAVRELNLWMEPLEDVCVRGRGVTVGDAMHVPEPPEYIDEGESLEKALSLYVLGVHQPLIVRNGQQVTGMLRFGDIFEVVRQRLLNCDLS